MSEFVCECGRLRPPGETCAGCGRRVPETISEKEWRSLQKRAAQANPQAAKLGTPEHKRRAELGKANYHKRHRN